MSVFKSGGNGNSVVKVPTVLQMEAAECGAASLAMVLAYYGSFIPLEELRVACGVSRDGSKAGNVLKAARNYGLATKGYKMEPQLLKQMKCPAIIHWNFNHFLVLEGFGKGYAYLNDPAGGRRKVTEEEFDQSFTGIVLSFKPSEGFKKQGQRPNVLKSLAKRLKGSEGTLIYLFFTGLLLSLLGLAIPVFTRIFIDDILLDGRTDWLSALLAGMIITSCLRGFLSWLQKHYFLRFENKIAISSSGSFLWHILRLPTEFFNQRYIGAVSSRIQNNDKVAKALSRQLISAVLNVVMAIFYLLLMFQYDAGLSVIGVMAAIINLTFLKYISSKQAGESNKLLHDQSKLYGVAMSGLQIIETLKATGSESGFFSKWAGYHAKVLNGEQRVDEYEQKLTIMPSVIAVITNTLVLTAGAYKIFDGEMTIGTLVAFQSLMSSFLEPIGILAGLGNLIQGLQGDINGLDDVLKYPVDFQFHSPKLEQGSDLCKLAGGIEMRNVTFGYNSLEPPLIENFNLTLKPGSRVALVGGSGSGKSTVIKLVTGIYQPWSGEILMDGRPVKDIPREVITNSLASVDQEIKMFEGSIRDNLTLWDMSISEADMIQGAKDASIHDYIVSRKEGYDYKIEEGGRNLSGGQRQQMEIARALAGKPSIIALDEATSALDPKTEMTVDENIRSRGCTCLIAAHRLSTIRDCDEIIVMEDGKVVQRGSHDEMKSLSGAYAALITG